ncbi:hypothetical protein EAH_00027660 [Eimeria acervulina]|uniref:Uncharacterized protein n=1 Tax=Eimeria acervulina TaxID=5801 RepID=U6GQD2_EIMAC|nr:hypothetical protein EAH_00027660 [Eimeria acervulina]CDI82405.1 hypothetical protein EAH_00027660 [Eimeria acervulina]
MENVAHIPLFFNPLDSCVGSALCSTLLLKDSPEAAEQEELLRLREEAEERRRELEAVEVSIEDDGGG